MARYCFYCGRELPAGERCRCKEPAAEEKTQSTGSSGRRSSSKASDSRGSSYSYQPSGAGTQAGFNGAAASAKSCSSTKTRRSRAQHDNPGRKSMRGLLDFITLFQQLLLRLFTLRDQVRTLFPNITTGLTAGVQYLTRPASKIRQESMRVKRPFSFVIYIVFSLLSGLLALLMSRSGSPLFTNMVAVILGDSQTLLFSNPIFSFTGISVLAFLFVLAIAASFFVVARFNNRKPTFRKVMDLVSISLVYLVIMEIFVLITILMGSRGSLSLIFISLLIMGVTQLLSFRNALVLSEDIVFSFLIFAYIFSYILINFLLFISVRLLVFL